MKFLKDKKTQYLLIVIVLVAALALIGYFFKKVGDFEITRVAVGKCPEKIIEVPVKEVVVKEVTVEKKCEPRFSISECPTFKCPDVFVPDPYVIKEKVYQYPESMGECFSQCHLWNHQGKF